MANMGYCRFENTVSDMEDCIEHIDDTLEGVEATKHAEFIALCVTVAREYGYMIGEEVQ